jgi:hypothetical protein
MITKICSEYFDRNDARKRQQKGDDDAEVKQY